MDVSHLTVGRAHAKVCTAGVADRVTVEGGDILALQFHDIAFDRVLAESLTVFIDRPCAASELVLVCRPGGKVHATAFLWRKSPTPEAREIFS